MLDFPDIIDHWLKEKGISLARQTNGRETWWTSGFGWVMEWDDNKFLVSEDLHKFLRGNHLKLDPTDPSFFNSLETKLRKILFDAHAMPKCKDCCTKFHPNNALKSGVSI